MNWQNIQHIVPLQWGPYVDIAAMWGAAGATVRDPTVADEFAHALNARVTRFYWSLAEVPPAAERTHAAVAVYAEALHEGPAPWPMLPQHTEHLIRFLEAARHYDAVVVHTPAMARRLRAEFRLPVFTIPLGWSPTTTGFGYGPRRHVHHDIAWWGSPVGRRPELYDKLARWCAAQNIRGVDLTGKFGRELIGALDNVACVVYVAHSKVASYSTWRLWQCLAADVPVVSEPASLGDVWPFVWDTPYLRSIPYLDEPGGWEQLETEVRVLRTRGMPHDRLYPANLVNYTPETLNTAWRAAAAQAFLAFEESRHV